MKIKNILLCLFFVVVTFNASVGQTTQYTIVTSGTNLIVRFKPIGSDIVSENIVGVNVTIRWAKSHGTTFGTVTNHISGVGIAGQGATSDGDFWIEDYTSGSPFGTTQTYSENVEYDLITIPINQTGFGVGDFCLVHGGSYSGAYLEFGYGDATDYTTPFYGTGASSTTICASANLGSAITWIGTTTNWSLGSNWTGSSVPTQYQGALIPTSPSGGNFPELTATTTIKSLEISSSATVDLDGQSLTISEELVGTGRIIGSSSSSLTFSGSTSSTLYMDTTQWDTTNLLQNLTVNLTGASLTLGAKVGIIGLLNPTAGTLTTGGNLRICATSASTYGQINPSGSATISGDLTVQKALSNTNAGWRHIGLPVVGTLDAIDSFTVLDSNHTVVAEKNIKYWDAVPVSGNTAPGWTVPDSTFDNTHGYALYGSNSSGGKLDFDQIWSVTGTHSSGSKSFVVRNSEPVGSSGSVDNGWNLVANPYASNLDVSTLWTTTLNGLSYKAIHVYDQMADNYKAITANGVTIIGSAVSNSSTVVAPFQAFWVKSDIDGTISFNTANQTTSSSGLGTFMKNGYDLARLDVYTADSAWDQTVIYFDENGNPGLDNGLDAYKLFSYNPATPNLYSVTPEGNYAINAINSTIQTHSVPLGFRSSKTGQMSFNLNTTELDAKWFVYLEDKQLGIFYDIKANPYTFNHTQNSDSRFVLHFQTYGLSAEKLVNDVQNMNISGDGSAVYVFVPAFYKDQNYQLEVIDMAGRVVYTDTKLALNHGMNTLNLNLNANAYYAVRIKAAEGIVSGKVQIR